jgi:hypothetical protein
MGTNIMANQVKTSIQNYFEKVLYENLQAPVGEPSSNNAEF